MVIFAMLVYELLKSKHESVSTSLRPRKVQFRNVRSLRPIFTFISSILHFARQVITNLLNVQPSRPGRISLQHTLIKRHYDNILFIHIWKVARPPRATGNKEFWNVRIGISNKEIIIAERGSLCFPVKSTFNYPFKLALNVWSVVQ